MKVQTGQDTVVNTAATNLRGNRLLSWWNFVPRGIQYILFAFFTGFSLYLAWPPNGVLPLFFIAFIPLLTALTGVSRSKSKYAVLKAMMLAWLAYALWFALSAYWLSAVSTRMYVLSFGLNALNYALPLALFPLIYRRLGAKWGHIYFVAATVAAECMAQYSSFASPYFLMGYGLAEYPLLIQGYDWWGVEGGTLWILVVNALLHYCLIDSNKSTKWVPVVALISFPLLLSFFKSGAYDATGHKQILTRVHHSGMDPHTSTAMKNPVGRAEALFDATFATGNINPSLVVWPESVLTNTGWMHALDQDEVVQHLKKRLESYPETTLLVGGVSFSEATDDASQSRYATLVADPQRSYYYNTHNISLALRADRSTHFRSKELFIPFQERIPYLDQLPWLENVVDKVGLNAMFSTYPLKSEQFYDGQGNRFHPLLCYESIFPSYAMRQLEHSGVLVIQANEYWMKSVYGARQYFVGCTALATQSGKYVLRSSNGGVSAIVNPRGEVVAYCEGKRTANLDAKINIIYEPTLYASIAGYSYILTGIILVAILYQIMFNTIKTKL